MHQRVLLTAAAPAGLQSNSARIVLTSTSPEPIISDVSRRRVADTLTKYSCSVFPAPNAVVVICRRDAVGNIYKALRAAAQAGALEPLSLPPVKQCVKLKDISPAELTEAVACSFHRALLDSGQWHWWQPGSRLISVAILHDQPAAVEAHTLSLDVQLQGDTLQLLCTVGKVRYRPYNLPHVATQCLSSRIALANAQLPVEGVLCCLLPHCHHVMLAGFVQQLPNEEAVRLVQQLAAAGYGDVVVPEYWAVVRGSDDPDDPETCVLPGMVVTPQGMVDKPVTAQEALTVMQEQVMVYWAAMPGLWAGAPLQVTEAMQCCGGGWVPMTEQPSCERDGQQLRVEVRPALAAQLAAVQVPQGVVSAAKPRPRLIKAAPVLKRRVAGVKAPTKAPAVRKAATVVAKVTKTTAPVAKAPKAEVDVAAVAARLAAHARAGTAPNDVTVPELKALLKSRGKPVGGKKAELVARAMET